MLRLRQLLILWFGFDLPVGPRTYRTHGFALFVLKYGVDALLVWLVLHRLWTPLDYLSPLLTRHAGIGNVPTWLLIVQMMWTLPFLWIGVGMTMRRAVDAGRSPWGCLLFLCPFVNYAVMLGLSFAPSRPEAAWTTGPAQVSAEGRLRAALQGLVVSLLACGAMVGVGTLVLHRYGATLFVLTPFVMGSVTAWLFNRERARSLPETVAVSLLALGIGCGAMVLFALEGAVCIVMALPIATPIVIVGAIIGRSIALHRGPRPATAALVLLLTPGLPLADLPRAKPPLREVCTTAIVNAPPEVVWRHVVTFSELDEPPRWFFRLGLAYPRRASISGAGVGAVRRCEFSTGPFVEPITVWDEPSRLAFDVESQPAPMTEWSPYAGLAPPHLSRAFRSRRGEFRLVALAGGRTRLEGRTWYALDMQPSGYWTLWSDGIVHAIHARVLAHVKTLAERERRWSAYPTLEQPDTPKTSYYSSSLTSYAPRRAPGFGATAPSGRALPGDD